jgi:hypothetical protein
LGVSTTELPAISDDELAELALAADPDVELDGDAVPWTGAGPTAGPLPSWYMPAAMTGRRGWPTRLVVAVVIAGFVGINAFGFCITYGLLTPA